MTSGAPVRITRSSLLKLVRRMQQVDRGRALLQKKRDALVLQLFARVRPSVDARRRIDDQAWLAYRHLASALAASGQAELQALAWPLRDWAAEAPPSAPGEAASGPLARSLAARAWLPGQVDPALEPAALAFEHLVELLLATAPEESAIRRLGRQLAQTVRQVNVLEQRVAVDLHREWVRVRRSLDERERDEAVRLRHIAGRIQHR